MHVKRQLNEDLGFIIKSSLKNRNELWGEV